MGNPYKPTNLLQHEIILTFTSEEFSEETFQKAVVRPLIKCQWMTVMEIWGKLNRMRLAQDLQVRQQKQNKKFMNNFKTLKEKVNENLNTPQ